MQDGCRAEQSSQALGCCDEHMATQRREENPEESTEERGEPRGGHQEENTEEDTKRRTQDTGQGSQHSAVGRHRPLQLEIKGGHIFHQDLSESCTLR